MIRTRQVRVIDDEGEQLGIMSPQDAMRTAEEQGLDLVEVAPNAQPPVCRIMDYGKYKYQQAKRAKESKKHQHIILIKEVKYRPKIDVHDFDYKTNHAREFLGEGHKVKVTIMFRGREMAHPEFGKEIIQRVIDATEDIGQAEGDVNRLRLEGRTMTLIIAPLPGKQRQDKKDKEKTAKADGATSVRREGKSKRAESGAKAAETAGDSVAPAPEVEAAPKAAETESPPAPAPTEAAPKTDEEASPKADTEPAPKE
jgi:translation initiation factor IF-3